MGKNVAFTKVAPQYFDGLYRRTMTEAYSFARREIVTAVNGSGKILDCGAYDGSNFALLNETAQIPADSYVGLEWSAKHVALAKKQRPRREASGFK